MKSRLTLLPSSSQFLGPIGAFGIGTLGSISSSSSSSELFPASSPGTGTLLKFAKLCKAAAQLIISPSKFKVNILLRLRQQLDSPVPWIGIAASGHPRPPYKRRPCDREIIGGTPSASSRP